MKPDINHDENVTAAKALFEQLKNPATSGEFFQLCTQLEKLEGQLDGIYQYPKVSDYRAPSVTHNSADLDQTEPFPICFTGQTTGYFNLGSKLSLMYYKIQFSEKYKDNKANALITQVFEDINQLISLWGKDTRNNHTEGRVAADAIYLLKTLAITDHDPKQALIGFNNCCRNLKDRAIWDAAANRLRNALCIIVLGAAAVAFFYPVSSALIGAGIFGTLACVAYNCDLFKPRGEQVVSGAFATTDNLNSKLNHLGFGPS